VSERAVRKKSSSAGVITLVVASGYPFKNVLGKRHLLLYGKKGPPSLGHTRRVSFEGEA
jgi:hypothetical protein